MTHALLLFLGNSKAKGVYRLALAVFLLPLFPATAVLDLMMALLRLGRRHAVLSEEVFLCPGGHELVLRGAWECASCGQPYVGHGFEPCPHCRAIGYSVHCSCGRVLVNPLFDRRAGG